MLLTLRDVRELFSTYSALDINALIAAKMKSVREPRALKQLYDLEKTITEVRLILEAAKEAAKEEKE